MITTVTPCCKGSFSNALDRMALKNLSEGKTPDLPSPFPIPQKFFVVCINSGVCMPLLSETLGSSGKSMNSSLGNYKYNLGMRFFLAGKDDVLSYIY